MPYHVRITLKSNLGEDIIRLDLNKEELFTRYKEPYEDGRPILTGGIRIQPDDIYQFRINETKEDSSILKRRIRIERRVGGFYSDNSNEWMVTTKGKDVTDQILTYPPNDVKGGGNSTSNSTVENPRKVFVVHGRNEKLRSSMFSFLRSIDLDPIEWSQAVRLTGETNPYIGNILEIAFTHANAVVALMSPDDEGKLLDQFIKKGDPVHDKEYTPQARLNVIFEAGMAMGRNPDKTILVEIGNPRPFSDIGGRHVIKLDNSTEKRQQFAHRLESAGCPINLEGTDWHKEGDFEIQMDEPESNEEEPRIVY